MGMTSHDCHVVMQRLLPFAFEGLLPNNVYKAVAEDSKLLCELEKIFPPSFFDVMEHLPVHLPREAELGGPVPYRWMYPFERFMFHLKKKVKNLSRVEGSIVAQSLNEETSHFASNYFPSNVRTKSRRPSRHDDGGQRPIYQAWVPDIFSQIGRLSGKAKNECYQPRRKIICIKNEFEVLKTKEFVNWMKCYIKTSRSTGEIIPTWLEELVYGPKSEVTCYPRYCTRGFAFQIFRERSTRSTSDFGISSRSGDIIYYGVLREILEVQFPGLLNLRCIVFNCDWYDPVNGLRHDEFGVTSVHCRKRLRKYDPFILALQADQVCYIPYPRVKRKQDPWITVTSVNPRGKVFGDVDHDPLQQNTLGYVGTIEPSLEVNLVVDFTMENGYELFEDSEEEIDEFDENNNSAPSDYSSDSE
ncbi:unnamed protein product [Microthlaspi erraticum]|uniref:DUF4218 domain-containing protein n=1 Tax=Microthlaspi erraticum TaxID=1685480 RepID=A0A6D2HTL7_9BRAS|nr:unnamed protein product [Microthlaspi erraticum]